MAYGLPVTSDVLPRHGIAGLYTSTLFRFDARFFERIGPAVELGRSFVMPSIRRTMRPAPPLERNYPHRAEEAGGADAVRRGECQ